MGTLIIILQTVFLSFYYINNNGKPKKIKKVFLLIFLGFISLLGSALVQQVFIESGLYPDGRTFNNALTELIAYIVAIGVVEEVLKLVCIKLGFNKSKEDIFLSAFVVAITFETLESFAYISDTSVEIAYLRSILPFHVVCQVIMSYFLCKSYDYKMAGDKSSSFIFLLLSFLIPAISHGCFDYIFGSVSDNNIFIPITLLSVISYIILFIGVKNMPKITGVHLENQSRINTINIIFIGIAVVYLLYVIFFVLNRIV